MKPGSTRSSVAKTRRRLWEEPVRGTGAGGADDKDSDGGRAAMTRRLFGRLDVDSLKRELQVLSEQYSQKCLEIGQLTEKAEEREQTLQRCQQEGKQLLRKNQAREGLSLPAGTTEHLSFHWGLPLSNLTAKSPLFGHILPIFYGGLPAGAADPPLGRDREAAELHLLAVLRGPTTKQRAQLLRAGGTGLTGSHPGGDFGSEGSRGAARSHAGRRCASFPSVPLPGHLASLPSSFLSHRRACARGSGHPAALCFPLP